MTQGFSCCLNIALCNELTDSKPMIEVLCTKELEDVMIWREKIET